MQEENKELPIIKEEADIEIVQEIKEEIEDEKVNVDKEETQVGIQEQVRNHKKKTEKRGR